MLYNEQRLFFISNHNNIDNIWSMNLDGSDIKQHTNFSNWAVRDANIDNDKIVFQHGADIKIYDIAKDSVSNTNISIQSDFTGLRTKYIQQPMQYFESASLANSGDSAILTARGKLALVNSSGKRLVNVYSGQSARIRNALLSNDGKTVYAISDQTGDYEIWAFDAMGKPQSEQLTSGGQVLKTNLWLSPNGRTLLYTEKTGGLFSLNLKSKKVSEIASELLFDVTEVSFSNDSRFAAISSTAKGETRSQIYLYEFKSQKAVTLSSSKYTSYSPAFSDDLHWLYFLSERAFTASPSSPWGDRNMGVAFDNRTKIFAIALTKEARFPFSPPTELDIEAGSDDKKNNREKTVKLDFDNIQNRLWDLNIEASNYSRLFANKQALFLLEKDTLFSLKFAHDAKPKTMTSGVSAISMSNNLEHLLIQKGQNKSASLFAIPALADYPKEIDEHLLDVQSWTLSIEPKAEWLQIFKDAWLMHRDSLFDTNMRGIDWPATKQKYLPLLSRVTERSELNDIFEQMMGELNALHSQV